jgi:hypothetical protein
VAKPQSVPGYPGRTHTSKSDDSGTSPGYHGVPYVRMVTVALPLVDRPIERVPSSNSLTASVPVARAGMASGTADLQRDLGGALLQSIFGALLAAGFATTTGAALAEAPTGTQVSSSMTAQLEASYASAEQLAAQ